MKKKNKKDEWEGDCDDCAICRAMKNGEADSMEGLMKAFKEVAEELLVQLGLSDHTSRLRPLVGPP